MFALSSHHLAKLLMNLCSPGLHPKLLRVPSPEQPGAAVLWGHRLRQRKSLAARRASQCCEPVPGTESSHPAADKSGDDLYEEALCGYQISSSDTAQPLTSSPLQAAAEKSKAEKEKEKKKEEKKREKESEKTSKQVAVEKPQKKEDQQLEAKASPKKSSEPTIDLLGLDGPAEASVTNGGTATAAALNDDLDIFGPMISNPLPAAAVSPAQSASTKPAAATLSAASGDLDLFTEQTTKSEESAKKQLSKDSILSLYGTGTMQQQNAPGMFMGSSSMPFTTQPSTHFQGFPAMGVPVPAATGMMGSMMGQSVPVMGQSTGVMVGMGMPNGFTGTAQTGVMGLPQNVVGPQGGMVGQMVTPQNKYGLQQNQQAQWNLTQMNQQMAGMNLSSSSNVMGFGQPPSTVAGWTGSSSAPLSPASAGQSKKGKKKTYTLPLPQPFSECTLIYLPGRSYRRPPTSPTGHTDTLRVVRICKRRTQRVLYWDSSVHRLEDHYLQNTGGEPQALLPAGKRPPEDLRGQAQKSHQVNFYFNKTYLTALQATRTAQQQHRHVHFLGHEEELLTSEEALCQKICASGFLVQGLQEIKFQAVPRLKTRLLAPSKCNLPLWHPRDLPYTPPIGRVPGDSGSWSRSSSSAPALELSSCYLSQGELIHLQDSKQTPPAQRLSPGQREAVGLCSCRCEVTAPASRREHRSPALLAISKVSPSDIYSFAFVLSVTKRSLVPFHFIIHNN
ncbi:Stromal membrane-associated protein 1 [Aix galericulata]|nr:Stromal membrane-associated protein 1 [Aix galericulata]